METLKEYTALVDTKIEGIYIHSCKAISLQKAYEWAVDRFNVTDYVVVLDVDYPAIYDEDLRKNFPKWKEEMQNIYNNEIINKQNKMTENQINDLRCNIGGYISDERNSRKISQEKLSNMSGVSRQMISKIENGNENYEINALLKLILALDLRPIFIDFEENNEVENEIKKRFLLQKSEIDNFFVVTDVENQMVCTFENRKFNDTQSLRYLNDVSHTVLEIAKQMRELAEWLHENHKDII